MSVEQTFEEMLADSAINKLPIFDVLGDVKNALEQKSNLVLVAPPGAGKTTIIPLALLTAPWRDGRKILVLEPRRLAARAAAHRMASILGEPVGKRVGYRVRFDTKVSDQTIIEVITEGVFNRMLSQDPSLEHVACVLFDEFHERSLDGDMALALCLDLQRGLREDMRLVPMSATIDGGGVAALLNASVIESKGRSYPVDISYSPRKPDDRLEVAVLDSVQKVIREESAKGILVFLPGQAEIRKVERALKQKLPVDISIHCLFGALAQKEQQAAVQPIGPNERRIILATDIAETSLTVDGVDCVIDGGFSRQPRFEPATGFTRLETARISQASADQRAGRAGRTSPGRAIRLWNKGQNAALPKQTIPEILNTDLSGFLLSLADWGVGDVTQLNWMDEPPKPLLNEAKLLLTNIGAIDASGKITKHGRMLNSLAFSPRISHMIVTAAASGNQACERGAGLALLMQERGVGGNSSNLEERYYNCRKAKDSRTVNLMKMAERISRSLNALHIADHDTLPSIGALLAVAFPDRIATKTAANVNGFTRFRLVNGTGAQLETNTALAAEQFLVVADIIGKASNARITSAAVISKMEVEDIFESDITIETRAEFDCTTKKFSAKQVRQLGALQLSKPQNVKLNDTLIQQALTNAVHDHGTAILPWRDEDLNLKNRLKILHEYDPQVWPDVSENALLLQLKNWLEPFMVGHSDFSYLAKGALSDGLLLLAGNPTKNDLEKLVPNYFNAPSGSKVPFQYGKSGVVLSIRPQELFGLDNHPCVLNGKLPVAIELLSPAGRPIQITKDLPGFWRGSWSDVRADLRGRYPKHPWPEEPLSELPTSRTKPRK